MRELLEPGIVRELVTHALPAPTGTVLYANQAPAGPGVAMLGPVEHSLSRPAILAFRDDHPGANWMHPCVYAFVDVSTGALLATVESDRPPVFGFLPDTWTVVSATDRVPDLVPPSSQDDHANTEESS
ncbi:MAG: hypothetical protein J0I44_11185 [Microbacterium sp.]|nr:hypothetical protein [Microbacterium sp.]